MSVAHGDPIFAQVGLKATGFQLKFLILIEFPDILHWKPAKKIKLGVVLGQNLGQIMSNVVKKVKKQAISLGFFHILLWESHVLKQKVVVAKLAECKCMAIIAREVPHFKDIRAKYLSHLGRKWQKTDILFNNFTLVGQS